MILKIFDFIFGKKNITYNWVANPYRIIEVNFDPVEFGGTKIGQPVEKLSYLGPSCNCRSRNNTFSFDYKKYGFTIFIDEQYNLEGVLIYFFEKRQKGFSGILRNGNYSLKIDKLTTPEQIQPILGEPYQIESDNFRGTSYILYNYIKDNVEVQFAWLRENYVLESLEMGHRGQIL